MSPRGARIPSVTYLFSLPLASQSLDPLDEVGAERGNMSTEAQIMGPRFAIRMQPRHDLVAGEETELLFKLVLTSAP